MWDLETGRKTVDFPAHNGDVVSISVSPDGKTYVTGSVDKTCRLWDIREQSPKQTFFGHESDVNSVCVSTYYKVQSYVYPRDTEKTTMCAAQRKICSQWRQFDICGG